MIWEIALGIVLGVILLLLLPLILYLLPWLLLVAIIWIALLILPVAKIIIAAIISGLVLFVLLFVWGMINESTVARRIFKEFIGLIGSLIIGFIAFVVVAIISYLLLFKGPNFEIFILIGGIFVLCLMLRHDSKKEKDRIYHK